MIRQLLSAAALFGSKWTSIDAEHPARQAPPYVAIVGEWRGTSTCVDRKLAPACNDEVTVYTFTHAKQSSDTIVHVLADKIVNGVRESMGEFDLIFVSATHSWRYELSTPRVHAEWSFTPNGSQLDGALVTLPERAAVRRVVARKVERGGGSGW